MKWEHVKKALATVLTVTLLAGSVEGGISVQAKEMPKTGGEMNELQSPETDQASDELQTEPKTDQSFDELQSDPETDQSSDELQPKPETNEAANELMQEQERDEISETLPQDPKKEEASDELIQEPKREQESEDSIQESRRDEISGRLLSEPEYNQRSNESKSDPELQAAQERAVTGTCGENATYKLENGVLTISGSGSGKMEYLQISSMKNDIKKLVVKKGITEISSFDKCSKLEEVTLPDSISQLTYSSFDECTALKKITAPGVTQIYNWSFSGCKNLREYKFADNLEIAWRAFTGCTGLVDKAGIIRVGNVFCGFDGSKTGAGLKIPEGITSIAPGSIQYDGVKPIADGRFFSDSKITSISIPSTLKGELKKGEDSYLKADLIAELTYTVSLKSIAVAANNPWYSVADGCLLNKNKTKLLVCPKAKKGNYVVPKSVETIGYAALSRCAYLTEVTIPKNVKKLEGESCAVANQAPLYFEGNAPKEVPAVFEGRDMPAGSVFYDKYYDSDGFKKWIEELAASTEQSSQQRHKYYMDLLNEIKKQKIYYNKKTTGWDKLKAGNPRVSFVTWDGNSKPGNGSGTTVVKATGIKLSKTKTDIKKGKTLTLKATVAPVNASNKSVKWTSSNTKVAAVSSSGKVKAKGYGTATITATAKDGSGKKAGCKVTVPYTITYKLNRGSNHKKNPSGYYNQKVTLYQPARSGYTFKGWYTDSKYKNKITSIKKGTKKNYTLYAKWKKVSVKATRITSAKNSNSKQIALKFKKVSGVKGYEISYTTDKNLKKSVVRKTTAKTAYTIKNLKKGQTYYVRARSYQVDSAGKKVYSNYSKTYKVAIRK